MVSVRRQHIIKHARNPVFLCSWNPFCKGYLLMWLSRLIRQGTGKINACSHCTVVKKNLGYAQPQCGLRKGDNESRHNNGVSDHESVGFPQLATNNSLIWKQNKFVRIHAKRFIQTNSPHHDPTSALSRDKRYHVIRKLGNVIRSYYWNKSQSRCLKRMEVQCFCEDSASCTSRNKCISLKEWTADSTDKRRYGTK